MNIDYVLGSKEDFFRFLETISLQDKVAILAHNDLDGISSTLLLEKILGAKRIKADYVEFLEIKSDMAKEVLVKLKDNGVTKVIIADLNLEGIDYEGFEEMRNEMGVFLIDHHPIGEKLIDKSNIIKAVSQDCTCLIVFILGEDLIDSEEWGWLVCAAIFADYSFRSEKNLKFLKSFYPEVEPETISSSVPGINARKISSALIYYKNDPKYVFSLLKEKNLEEISETHEIIEKEVYRAVDDFPKNRKYYPKKGIYFYEIKSPFDILSYVATLIGGADPDKTMIFMMKMKNSVRFSARSSNGGMDMGELMKKGIEGLEDANGGGHVPAAAAQVKIEDVEIFKKRVLEDD